MDLLVLGCHAGMPAGGQARSGYLVGTDECRVLLDCGPGVATALSAHGGAAGLDGILLSHLHPDHCYDQLPIGTTLRREGLPAPLPLFAPKGVRALLHALAQVFPLHPDPRHVTPFYRAFEIHEYRPGDTIEVGDCTLTVHALRHAVPNCGIRVNNASATMAYTGDTGPTDSLLNLASGADLLLAEATLAETETGDYGHLSAADAGRLAADANVGQLVLTHLGSTDTTWAHARRVDATSVFAGPVHLARPGDRYRVRP